MMCLYNSYFLLLILAFFTEMRCLQVSELKVKPSPIPRGEAAIFHCIYSLQGAPLYSVKWYRGPREFYRYSPGENPMVKVFPFNGIYVDLSQSNSTHVTLQKVGFQLSGNFSCEVSADAPFFSTAIVTTQVEVVALPQGRPTIVTEKPQYDPGDILRANCTAPPSRPLVNLTFFINTMQISPGLLRYQPVDEGLYRADLSISFLLLPEHYSDGPPTLRCLARVSDLYNQIAELFLRENDGPPRIGRVTSGTSPKDLKVVLLLLLCMLVQVPNIALII